MPCWQDTTAQDVNEALKQGAEEATDVLFFSMDPLVSADYRRSPYSSVIDGLSTMVTGNNLARVVTWYDNEWSYSCRVVDLALYIKKREREEKEAVLAGQT